MKAVQITAPSEMRVVEVGKPAVNTGEVSVKIEYMGFCDSDLNTSAGRNPMVRLPVIPGHEVGVTTEEVGPSVPAELEKGMNVTLSPYTSCGKCASCRSGCVNACEHNETLGAQRSGVMCEYTVLPWSKIIPVGDITPRDRALIESTSVGFYAVSRGQITNNEHVMVIDCGMIGTGATVRVALREAKVITVDLDNEKLELTKRVGASYVINPKTENVYKRMLDITEDFGTDVVIEAVGSPVTYVTAVDEVAFVGRVACTGYAKSEVVFQTKYFVQKEIDIHGSRSALPADFRAATNYMKSGNRPIEELIFKTVSPENALNAMEEWAATPGEMFRILVQS